MFNPQDHAAKRSEEDAVFADAYSRLHNEFSALDVLLQAYKSVGLTQAEGVSAWGQTVGIYKSTLRVIFL